MPASDALKLLCALAESLERDGDLPTALATIVKEVCRSCGWVGGESWTPAGDRLRPGPSWFRPGFSEFARRSRDYRFRRGEGLPGRVWASRKPAWVRDVRDDLNFPRRGLARVVGLRAGLAVPVLARGRVVAVLGFFSRRRQDEDRGRLRVVAAVAAQLGSLLRRRNAEASLRTSRLALAAREAERQRLARELHDGVGQLLSSAAFRLQREDAAELRPVRRLVESAVSEVRRLARNLGPAALRDLGFLPAVRMLGRELAARSGARVDVLEDAFPAKLPAGLSLELYRILQESLSNVERHAGATRVSVRLRGGRRRLRVVVRDDGRGFDLARPGRAGLGLGHVRERASLLGGELRLRSSRGAGTEIGVSVPWAP
ncbi:MAG TPA: GAF domain-containing sensor histidine kinase [Planctomycetota bacterium]